MKQTVQLVLQWAENRNIIKGATPAAQMLKGTEECGEIMLAVLDNDRAELVDGLGDELVVATILCAQLGLNAPEFITHMSGRHADIRVLTAFDVDANCYLGLEGRYVTVLELGAAKGRLAGAIAKNKPTEQAQAMRSVVQAVANVCATYHIDMREAYQSAYEVIKDRKGKMVNGVYVKEGDL